MGFRLLALVSFLGLVFSAVCHAMAWMGLPPPGGMATFAGLHLGIFVVWFPLVASANRTMPPGAKNNLDHLTALLPNWVRKVETALTVYAVANFLVFIYQAMHYSKHELPRAIMLRGFSGHWMLFYGAATAGFVALARLTRQKAATGEHRDRPLVR
ncbi:MAG: hypothetical protein QM765_40785 [Myxococcales bacterium]